MGKPFIVLMNCVQPESKEAADLCAEMSEKYNVPVLPVNCLELTESEIKEILANVLYEFPVTAIGIDLPCWFKALESNDKMKSSLINTVKAATDSVDTVRSVYAFSESLMTNENVKKSEVEDLDLSTGKVKISVSVDSAYFYTLLSAKCGMSIKNDRELLQNISNLSDLKHKYERIETALKQVDETGYGIVMPTLEELSLEEPEIMKQGGKYGVRLKAHAPSIHMIKCNTYTEVAPIVGSESQSEELVMYLLKEFENNPSEIWNTNIFGKSLNSLVNEGLNNKLYRMPEDARNKFRETIERVINEGCSGLICIIL